MSMVEIDIFGAIGIQDFWDDTPAVDLKSVKAQVDAVPDATEILVNISSPGGSVDEGFAIHDYLVNSGKNVTTRITGLCASIATVIAQAGSAIQITKNSQFMIHNPYTYIEGDADALKKGAEDLQKYEDRIAAFYAHKTGMSVDDLDVLMKAETWMTPEEALNSGFVTEIIEPTAKAETNAKIFSLLNKTKDGKKLLAVAAIKNTKRKPNMSKLEDLLKRAKNLVAPEVVNASYTLEDGTAIMTDAEGEIATGQIVTYEDGTIVPEGEHILNDGRVVVTDAEGIVTEVRDAAPEAEAHTEILESILAKLDSMDETLKAHDEAIARVSNETPVAKKQGIAVNHTRNPKAKVTEGLNIKQAIKEFQEIKNKTN